MNNLEDDTDIEAKRFGWPVDPYRLVSAIKRGWYWLFVSLAVGLAVGAVVAQTMIPQAYHASTIFVVDSKYTDRDSLMEVQSIVAAIMLPNNLREAHSRLALRMSLPEFASHIAVEFNPRRSSMLRITITWPSVDEVVSVANTVAGVFIDYQKQQAEMLNQEMVDNVQADLDVALERMTNTQRAYDWIRKEKGFSDIATEIRIAVEEASRLRFEADRVGTETRGLKGALDQFQTTRSSEASGRLGEYAEEITYLRSELDLARSRLEIARERLPPEHPTIEALQIQIETLEERLPVDHRGRSLSSVSNAYTEALGRQQTLESIAANAETRLKELARGNSEVANLLLEISVAERHVQELKLQLETARDRARNPTVIFRLLEKAKHASATKSIRPFVALGFGLGFTILMALGLLTTVIKGLRVYTANEAAFWSKLPVIGSSTWPRDPDTLQGLIRDFDDFTPTSTGSTLVVSLSDSEEERDSALVLARSLNRFNARKCKVAEGAEPIPDPEPSAGDSPVSTSDAWTGPISGPDLRRATRLADRIIVTAFSGRSSLFKFVRISSLLGRTEGVGLLLLGQDYVLAETADRAGPVEEFWRSGRKVDER